MADTLANPWYVIRNDGDGGKYIDDRKNITAQYKKDS